MKEDEQVALGIPVDDGLTRVTRLRVFALKRFHVQGAFLIMSHIDPNEILAADSRLEKRMESAMRAMREGRMVIMMDDEDRENEGDLIASAELMNEKDMAMMIRDGSGIVCLCLFREELDRLGLPPMVSNNENSQGTAFTVTIEAAVGVTTGVSAHDRIRTIQAAMAVDAKPTDLVRPGHVFPLAANSKGVLGRRGHTEGSVDLARLAGLKPAAVLCELMNPDGTMMRGAALEKFAADHDMPFITIEDIAAWRKKHNC